MAKKFGLFDNNDLFFARKLRPLADGTKMRKFQGSRVIAFSLLFAVGLIPYWYFPHYLGFIEIISHNKLLFNMM